MREDMCRRDEKGEAPPPSLCWKSKLRPLSCLNKQSTRAPLQFVAVSCALTPLRSTFFPITIARCITFLYHALGEEAADDGPTLASMDFSASGKSISSGSGRGGGKGYGVRGRYKLIVASNRDEFLGRPTAPIHFWEDANSNLLAGVPRHTRRRRGSL